MVSKIHAYTILLGTEVEEDPIRKYMYHPMYTLLLCTYTLTY